MVELPSGRPLLVYVSRALSTWRTWIKVSHWGYWHSGLLTWMLLFSWKDASVFNQKLHAISAWNCWELLEGWYFQQTVGRWSLEISNCGNRVGECVGEHRSFNTNLWFLSQDTWLHVKECYALDYCKPTGEDISFWDSQTWDITAQMLWFKADWLISETIRQAIFEPGRLQLKIRRASLP